MMSPRRCPNTLPTSGRKPGSDRPYWLRYDRLKFLTSISPLATTCMVLYQLLFSSGSFGVTSSFTVVAESTFDVIFILLLSMVLYFSLIIFPSFVFADTMSRLLFLPWFTVIVVSGRSVISFSKDFLFFGSSFASLRFLLASLASLGDLAPLRFFFVALLVRLLNLSLAFFRNGMWL